MKTYEIICSLGLKKFANENEIMYRLSNGRKHSFWFDNITKISKDLCLCENRYSAFGSLFILGKYSIIRNSDGEVLAQDYSDYKKYDNVAILSYKSYNGWRWLAINLLTSQVILDELDDFYIDNEGNYFIKDYYCDDLYKLNTKTCEIELIEDEL